MSQFSDERVDVGLKILARNDAYLASVNTKSTILLTFSAAVIAAIGLNYSKFEDSIQCDELSFWFGVFVALSVLSFIASSFVSLRSIYPSVQASKQKNLVSFVDVFYGFSDEGEYAQAFGEESAGDLVSEISYLNYNLSKVLIKKNKAQAIAVALIGLATVFLLLALLMILIG